jgi:hypothetical protein
MATFYTFLFLQEALTEHKCRASRPYITTLEQLGIIPKPQHELITRRVPTMGNVNARIYQAEEIQTIIGIIKNLPRGKGAYKAK